MELAIRNLTKKYSSQKVAVNDMSVDITPGAWGLLGANGAGKTTLMKMVCGILSPTNGEISFDGKPIRQLGERYRNVLGYLPQAFGFSHDSRIYDYLIYVSTLKGIPEKKAKIKIDELLEEVSLTDVKRSYIRNLSGGMKRRVGIAQALLNEPEVLILDEPTAGLDPSERIHFRKILSAFSKDRIVLLSTHIVSDVEYISKNNLIMRKGRLLAKGPTEELLSSINGHVWQCNISSAMLDKLENKLCIVNTKNEGGNAVSIRYISEEPLPNSQAQAPRLEDVYLSFFMNGDGKEEN